MSEWDNPEAFECRWCDDTHWPHHHEAWLNAYGEEISVVVMHVKDPNAEARDPDTGEVIFPARKAPFKLIEGGLPSDEQNPSEQVKP